MLIKTVLIKIEKYSSFVYSKVYFGVQNLVDCMVIEIHPRVNSKGRCPECKKRCSTYEKSIEDACKKKRSHFELV